MSPGTINIVVLHGEAAAREALCDFIADQVGMRVIGGTGEPAAVADLLRAAPVHVLIVHHPSVGGGTAGLIVSAKAVSPQSGVLVLTASDAQGSARVLELPGAAACLDEARVDSELVGALRTIAMGRRYRAAP